MQRVRPATAERWRRGVFWLLFALALALGAPGCDATPISLPGPVDRSDEDSPPSTGSAGPIGKGSGSAGTGSPDNSFFHGDAGTNSDAGSDAASDVGSDADRGPVDARAPDDGDGDGWKLP